MPYVLKCGCVFAALVKAMLINSARLPESVFTVHDVDGYHGDCQPALVDSDTDVADATQYCAARCIKDVPFGHLVGWIVWSVTFLCEAIANAIQTPAGVSVL